MTSPASRKSPRRKKLSRSFYARGAEAVARDLLGKILVHRVGKDLLQARVIETEAYVGAQDLACHANHGRTARTDVMFGPPGHAYVYLIYGIHEMLNVVVASENDAQAVLIRSAEPLGDLPGSLIGPGRLTRAMQIDRKLNRIDLTGDVLWFESDGSAAPQPACTRRIGIDYAGDWKHALLRFIDAGAKAAPSLIRQGDPPRKPSKLPANKPLRPTR